MSNPKSPLEFQDPIIKRNYYLILNYLTYLLDSGLNYLKREYLARYEQDSYLTQFSASSFFEFILRDNIRNKVRSQIRAVLSAAYSALEFFNGKDIAPTDLDRVIEKKYPIYAKSDMTLLHTNATHRAHRDLKVLSKLTYRVVVIQTLRVLACRDLAAKTYEDLITRTYKTYEDCRQSVHAILSMIDQMIDIFESNLDIIDIPLYKPTFTLRDFYYVRKVYEYSLQILNDIMKRNYGLAPATPEGEPPKKKD